MQDLIRKAGEIVLACMDDVDATSSEVLEFSEAMLNLAEAYDVVSAGEAESDGCDEILIALMMPVEATEDDLQ